MSKADKSPSYQELSHQLDDLMARLQTPEVGIDEAVHLFEDALKLIQQMETHLEKAENHIQELKSEFGEGA